MKTDDYYLFYCSDYFLEEAPRGGGRAAHTTKKLEVRAKGVETITARACHALYSGTLYGHSEKEI